MGVSPVYPGLKTWLQGEAVKDAARRARAAASNAGAALGQVKVIDPTGRACETDVLAGWPSYGSGGLATDVDASDIVVTGARMAPPPLRRRRPWRGDLPRPPNSRSSPPASPCSRRCAS